MTPSMWARRPAASQCRPGWSQQSPSQQRPSQHCPSWQQGLPGEPQRLLHPPSSSLQTVAGGPQQVSPQALLWPQFPTAARRLSLVHRS